MLYVGLFDQTDVLQVFGCKDNIVELVEELEKFKRDLNKSTVDSDSEFHIYVIDKEYDIDLITCELDDVFKSSFSKILSIKHNELCLDIDDSKIQLLLILKRADCYQFDIKEDITSDLFK